MRRAAEVLTTLILFAIVMTAIGWGVNATVPSGVDWVADRIGDLAFLGILGMIFIAAVAYAWRGHRPKAGRAGKAVGR
ncbi:hypothetical protein [Methylobacterium sp. GC_Met_2]|uniref:hypothetical protein n=1 Tax=Methylobacterium sp. GC_Met_2 TaxID=2937376 RepID=UPI00226B39D0|nr:hypothetical protein [Methylobacterium sp. GC_Met_2]